MDLQQGLIYFLSSQNNCKITEDYPSANPHSSLRNVNECTKIYILEYLRKVVKKLVQLQLGQECKNVNLEIFYIWVYDKEYKIPSGMSLTQIEKCKKHGQITSEEKLSSFVFSMFHCQVFRKCASFIINLTENLWEYSKSSEMETK